MFRLKGGELRKIPNYIIYSFAVGFFISLIVGFIRHNPAGVVFFRAIISASLFSAIVYLCSVLLKKYTPEIWSIGEELNIGKMVSGKESTGKKSKEEMRGEVSTEGKDEDGVGTMVDYLVSDKREEKISPSGDHEKAFGEVKGLEKSSGLESMTATPSGIAVEPEEEEARIETLPGEEGKELPPIEELLEEDEEDLLPSTDENVSRESPKSESKMPGGYIKIGERKFPYDPEVFAKAIKKVLREDENR